MSDSKIRKKQERAQAAAFDLFNTLKRLGAWRCHLVIGRRLGEEVAAGEFEHLSIAGMNEAAMESTLDDITITFARPPEKQMVEIETTPEGETTTEVEEE